MVNFNFYNPTKIIFGSGKLDELAGQELPGKKALLLISCGKSTRVNGSLARVQAALDKAGVSYVLFDKIMENPVKEVVMEGAACARENGCDFILALGGGAVLDSSKAIAAMATNDGDLWDYVVGGTGKGKPLANKGLPIVTVPTSSGTGSEINCWGVISISKPRRRSASARSASPPFSPSSTPNSCGRCRPDIRRIRALTPSSTTPK